jgi:N-methylhydantoinase A/oxoprolinase/acetone carboxylase beta subunit
VASGFAEFLIRRALGFIAVLLVLSMMIFALARVVPGDPARMAMGPAASAEQVQAMTFASGPTNSMRGAAFLTGVKDAIVIDIGGTTTDVGALQHGFPRQASTVVDVGGVRTNFRMPDVFSIGLGGGTRVEGTADAIKVGPKSVGYRLARRRWSSAARR